MFAELKPVLSREPHPEAAAQVPSGGGCFPQPSSEGAKRPRSGTPQRGENLCFPISLQSTWKLQANDQDWAAGSEAKNSDKPTARSWQDLLLGRPVAERATKQGEVSDLLRESRGHGGGDLKLTGVQGSHLEMFCFLAAPDECFKWGKCFPCPSVTPLHGNHHDWGEVPAPGRRASAWSLLLWQHPPFSVILSLLASPVVERWGPGPGLASMTRKCRLSDKSNLQGALRKLLGARSVLDTGQSCRFFPRGPHRSPGQENPVLARVYIYQEV